MYESRKVEFRAGLRRISDNTYPSNQAYTVHGTGSNALCTNSS